MHGPRPADRLISPRYGTVERPIDLERAHTIAIFREFLFVRLRKTTAGNAREGARRQVTQDGFRRRQVLNGMDRSAGHDLAAERPQIRAKRIGELLRPATRKRPSDDVRERAQHEADRARRKHIERNHPVRRDSGKQGPRPLGPKLPPRQPIGALECTQSKPRDSEWVTRKGWSTEN